MKYAEDIEAMVRNPERKAEINAWHEAQERKKQSEIVKRGILQATLCILFGLMGVMQLAVIWIAAPVCIMFGLASAFTFGRWYENGKLLGWK